MATAPLFPIQIQEVFQALVIQILGLPLGDAAYSAVRVGWQTQGQPAQSVKDDVVYVRAETVDSEYSRQRDLKSVYDGPTLLSQVVTYIRVWKINFNFWGPNSFDHARVVHSALMTDQGTHDFLSNALLALVTDPPVPRRVPEEAAGQWWERTDFWADFNELVTESTTVNAVASAEVIIETRDGVVADITAKGA